MDRRKKRKDKLKPSESRVSRRRKFEQDDLAVSSDINEEILMNGGGKKGEATPKDSK